MIKIDEKEQFCKYINFIIDQHNKEEKLREAMSELSSEFSIDFYPFMEYESMLVELLNEKYKLEKDDLGETDIQYYLYELDYGKRWREYPITIVDFASISLNDKETIYLDSPEALYDFISRKYM